MGLTLPLCSYSYALFCTVYSSNSFPLNNFRTLCQNTGVGGYMLQTKNLSSRPRGCHYLATSLPLHSFFFTWNKCPARTSSQVQR
jgi:hypothetical protein